LILFGQDCDSMCKVFTDTDTWRFSQEAHPPILDHTGHYLCTVGTKGGPGLVKSFTIGKRNGNLIVINRQSQIANAFEEMISEISPSVHRMLRLTYDTHRYSLSNKINSEPLSNLTYILMKPIEWIFLISVYLICNKPEEVIKKQYM